MDWQDRMEQALTYLENNLTGVIDQEQAAREANCSVFHFMRMFEIITGSSPAEYVRRRKLSCAAMELASSKMKIIDIALKYGYESPDAFARAFRREFNCLPSEARKEGVQLHAYPPISFSIALKGDKPMEYRIETSPEFSLTGLSLRCNNKDGSNFIAIPAFWDRVMQGKQWKSLCAKSGKTLGIVGVCYDFDMQTGDFSYAIAIETPAEKNDLPEECEDILIPESTWAKFTSRGPIRPNLQETVKRIFSEWFPSSGREHAGTAEIEYYPPLPNCDSPDYWCEYWVPVM